MWSHLPTLVDELRFSGAFNEVTLESAKVYIESEPKSRKGSGWLFVSSTQYFLTVVCINAVFVFLDF